MMRSLFTAATGMEAQQVQIDTISNNLANVNTTAFKGSRANFHDLLYQTQKSPGQNSTAGTVAPTGIQIGGGSKVSSVEKIFTEGAIRITNKTTDLMIEGQGFFRVQKDDGTIAYSRDGSFNIDNTGRLTTRDGLPLVPEVQIPEGVTHDKINVGLDGTVTVKVGSETQEIGQIVLANFVNPTGLESLGRNLYTDTAASGPALIGQPNTQGFGRIGQGQLEASNVNIVEEMVNMISGQRAYEINSKVIQTGDQMLQQTNNIR